MSETSYIILGIIGEQNGSVTPICALCWCGFGGAYSSPRIIISQNWRQHASNDKLAYLSDLLEDMKERFQADPETLIRAVNDLSIGPIRFTTSGTITAGTLELLLTEQLGEHA